MVTSCVRPLIAVATCLLLLTACGSGGSTAGAPRPSPSDGSIHVVATTSIIGDVVGEVLGDEHTLDVLMGPGADPHAVEISAQQARQMRDGDLLVVNGLQLEQGLIDAIEAAEQEGTEVLRLTDHVELIDFALADDTHDHAEGEGDAHEAEGEQHDAADPHIWQDPLRMAEAVEALGERLAELAPTDDDLRSRAQAYAEELREVHERNTRVLEAVPPARRKLVTSHDSMGYFADRYGFEVIGAIIPGGATLGDPSSQDFQQLADLVEREAVPAVFGEVTQPTRLAESLTREVGRDVEVVVLYTDALGEEGSGAETYLGLLRTNAQLVADALSG